MRENIIYFGSLWFKKSDSSNRSAQVYYLYKRQWWKLIIHTRCGCFGRSSGDSDASLTGCLDSESVHRHHFCKKIRKGNVQICWWYMRYENTDSEESTTERASVQPEALWNRHNAATTCSPHGKIYTDTTLNNQYSRFIRVGPYFCCLFQFSCREFTVIFSDICLLRSNINRFTKLPQLTSNVTILSVTPCMLLSIRFSFRLPFNPRAESQVAS